MQHDNAVDHIELQCAVYDITYNFPTRTGVLLMEDGNCCDMSGCIAFFQRIDPEVTSIFTKAGNEPDTTYVKTADGWIAK